MGWEAGGLNWAPFPSLFIAGLLPGGEETCEAQFAHEGSARFDVGFYGRAGRKVGSFAFSRRSVTVVVQLGGFERFVHFGICPELVEPAADRLWIAVARKLPICGSSLCEVTDRI